MLSGLAFYLLSRWDLGEEAFPDFSEQSAWYETCMLKGKGSDPTAEFSYNSQQEWVTKAFEYAGIFSKKKTHLFCSEGAKMAELKRISENQIRQAER